MHFKLICVLVDDHYTDAVLKAAREAGATGATVLSQARGESGETQRTFFGLALEAQRDFILLLVEEHMSRNILETIAEQCHFEERPGTGIAFQIDVEDAVGVRHQIEALVSKVEEEL
jgi:nitrogen regulatory protein PII